MITSDMQLKLLPNVAFQLILKKWTKSIQVWLGSSMCGVVTLQFKNPWFDSELWLLGVFPLTFLMHNLKLQEYVKLFEFQTIFTKKTQNVYILNWGSVRRQAIWQYFTKNILPHDKMYVFFHWLITKQHLSCLKDLSPCLIGIMRGENPGLIT